ncbi:hypothetical protein J6590_037787 [Homalodisca vitripennis]|nr:hypothetical protein J6590_037787 [Homalodisca vitripennis]
MLAIDAQQILLEWTWTDAYDHEGVASLALVPSRNVVAPAPLQPRAATIGNISMLLPLQPRLLAVTAEEMRTRTVLQSSVQAAQPESVNPSST